MTSPAVAQSAYAGVSHRMLRGLFVPFGFVAYFAGLFMVLAGLGVMLYQSCLWLRDGHWTYYTVGYAFGEGKGQRRAFHRGRHELLVFWR
jgi:hypothetical protein